MIRAVGIPGVALPILLALAGPSAARAPDLMLWAWEWRQDLRFLAGREVGVAFLAATVEVGERGVRTVRRRQPLWVPAGSYVVAVVRVEARGRRALDASARAEIVAAFAWA